MTIRYNGRPVVGFALGEAPPPPTSALKTSSPWPMVLATSVVNAAAGWAIEEVARNVRRKKR